MFTEFLSTTKDIIVEQREKVKNIIKALIHLKLLISQNAFEVRVDSPFSDEIPATAEK